MILNIILALIVVPILFTACNFIDKYMIDRVATTRSAWIFSGLFSFLVALLTLLVVVWLGGSVFAVPGHNIIMLLLVGVPQITWLFFYFKSFETEDPDSVVPLMQFIGVFTLLFGFVFLGEKVVGMQLVGLCIVLFGGWLLAFNPQKKLSLRKGALYMLASTFIYAISLVMFKKFAFSGADAFSTIHPMAFLVSIFWVYIGMGLTTLLVYISNKSFRKEFKTLLQGNTKRMFKIMMLLEVSNLAATVLVSYISLKIVVAKLSVLFESTQFLWVFIVGLVGPMLLPNFINKQEKQTPQALALKIIGIVLVIIGGVLLV